MKSSKDVLKEITRITSLDLPAVEMWTRLNDLNYHYEVLRAIEAGKVNFGKPQITLTSASKEVKDDSRGVRTVLDENWEGAAC